VWSIWGFALIWVLFITICCGNRYPWSDEWHLVPVRTNFYPLTFDWLWAQHNEHRIFIPKLVQMQIFWKLNRHSEFTDSDRNVRVTMSTQHNKQIVTACVNEIIDQIRIDPDDKPTKFRISRITITVTED
jgi:hypothetical protein